MMPYLKEDQREEVDRVMRVDITTNYLSSLKFNDFLGVLKYMNFKIVRRYLNNNGKRYYMIAGVVGTLICCVLEIYRRLAVPYEDGKKMVNKDVT